MIMAPNLTEIDNMAEGDRGGKLDNLRSIWQTFRKVVEALKDYEQDW